MKNLTILLLLMFCVSAFSQKTKLEIFSNADSAMIKIDEQDVGIAMKNSRLVVPVKPGVHTLIAVCRNETLNSPGFLIKKGESLKIDLTFEFAIDHTNLKNEIPVFLVVEEPATFQGGDLSNFNAWVSQNIRYPKEAVEKGLTGNIYVQFMVDEDGDVRDTKVLRGTNSILDQEAMRVILSSPKWDPPRQAGTNVRQLFTLPVNFHLKGNEKEKLAPDTKQTSSNNSDSISNSEAEKPAKFQGGDLNSFHTWATSNLRYPTEAFERGLSGLIYVKFTVNEIGDVENVKIIKSAGELLDNEVLRVVKSSPKWESAKLNDRPTKQTFTMPLSFKIQD